MDIISGGMILGIIVRITIVLTIITEDGTGVGDGMIITTMHIIHIARITIIIIILAAAIVRMVLEVIIITTIMTEIMLSTMDTAIQFKEASMLSIVVAVAKAAIEAEAQLTTTSKLLANAMKQQWEALLLHAAE